MHENDGLGSHGENNAVASRTGVPPLNPGVAPAPNPVDVGSHITLNVDLVTDVEWSVRGGDQPDAQRTQAQGEREVSPQVIFEMLQAQQVVIAQLQSQQKTLSVAGPETAHRVKTTHLTPPHPPTQPYPTPFHPIPLHIPITSMLDVVVRNISH